MMETFLTAVKLGIVGYLFLVGLLLVLFVFVKIFLKAFTKIRKSKT
ncbi:hypothetical protein [Thermotoga profunda]|nr:hypothetical protein [Thermotoga profunda]